MARTNAPEGAAILKQPISSHLTSDAVVRTVPLAELAGTLLPFISDEEWDEILNELKSAANGLSPDLDAMQCAVIRDLIRYYRRTAPGSADTDRPMSDHPLSMSMFASKADYEEAKDRFCDNNCTWRDHHPECPRHEDHALSIAGASGAPISDTEIQRIAGSDELTGDAILRFAGRLLADRGEEIAELRRQLDERGGVVELQRLRIAELERLYTTVNDLMTYMGYHGEAFAGGDRARAVMDALHAIDGGEIQSHPMGGAILRGEAASDFLKTIGALPRPSLSMHPADKLEMDRAFNEVADGVRVDAPTSLRVRALTPGEVAEVKSGADRSDEVFALNVLRKFCRMHGFVLTDWDGNDTSGAGEALPLLRAAADVRRFESAETAAMNTLLDAVDASGVDAVDQPQQESSND
jgi:hypothetical protein